MSVLIFRTAALSLGRVRLNTTQLCRVTRETRLVKMSETMSAEVFEPSAKSPWRYRQQVVERSNCGLCRIAFN